MKQLLKKPICSGISLILIINFNVTFAQQAKVVSSYGQVNQDVGFDQIKADRMKVKAERFYKQEMVNGMMMAHDGMIKTFPLRGIKDSPPYLHDGRCFTLEDIVEYFNLVQELHLTAIEKANLVGCMHIS